MKNAFKFVSALGWTAVFGFHYAIEWALRTQTAAEFLVLAFPWALDAYVVIASMLAASIVAICDVKTAHGIVHRVCLSIHTLNLVLAWAQQLIGPAHASPSSMVVVAGLDVQFIILVVATIVTIPEGGWKIYRALSEFQSNLDQ